MGLFANGCNTENELLLHRSFSRRPEPKTWILCVQISADDTKTEGKSQLFDLHGCDPPRAQDMLLVWGLRTRPSVLARTPPGTAARHGTTQ